MQCQGLVLFEHITCDLFVNWIIVLFSHFVKVAEGIPSKFLVHFKL